MKARMMAMPPSDPGHEVRVDELEEQPVEAEREQDEGDVRVGQQVQQRLQRVHRQVDQLRRYRGRASTDWPLTVTVRPLASATAVSGVAARPSMLPAATASSAV